MDTIFALSTPPGKAGVAIVRVSGPKAFDAAEKLAGGVPEPRYASLKKIRSLSGALIDEGLIIAFPKGMSFTGENVVEFQVHGSNSVVTLLQAELAKLDGFRHARNGEFTRRALENGRLDLTQVEGLADLIEAETTAQHAQAMSSFLGRFSEKAEAWRAEFVQISALLAVMIDFSDEDVPSDVIPVVIPQLANIRYEISAELDGVSVAERIRDGFEVAIVGEPNVGKSTLLNYIARREASIISDIPGTTRDVIEVRVDLRGLPITFLDTAGIRESSDPIEAMGVSRAIARAERADLRIFLVNGGESFVVERKPGDIVVGSKRDLGSDRAFAISGLSGEGVDELLSEISDILIDRVGLGGLATRTRHYNALKSCRDAIDEALRYLELGESSVDLAAEEVRSAVYALEELLGRVDVEEMLGKIFSSFCIGK
ncbi:tRNA modification GTPase trmE [Poseidonocella pacifica]|uniref:tRNA modification GTPase MnmE n=1 Tax=Poseidonocella pacifica TaxID=871651 RepID=A0A1I0XWQ0_9RHOB|nr:tRNA uridine-5-carboxymethylaminomethyl(34) synthesis GTPase MnmE [Poseidonocella pacifica]SFB04730.1 tRNA modification GTPase trmE [Poseidonocella pacifica]